MGREDFSQSSQLSTLVGTPTNRYKRLPKNAKTLKNLTQARAKPNNRLHHSTYPLIQKAYSVTYTQVVNLDFYSPIISILGNNPVSHLVNTPYVDAGVTLDEGSELYSQVSTVDSDQFGTYSVIYKARDGINPDTTVTRVVKVGLPPDATINGQNPFLLERFDVYVDPGITINESNSTLIFTASTVNNVAIGTYTVNYTVSNPAFTQVFSRNVRVDDTVPPLITITGGTPYELERFDPYVDEGANVDAGSVLTNTDLSNVQNTAIGSFDVVYTAYDGNTTTSNIRTVNVVDTKEPVITITNDTLQGNTLERFGMYVDEGATVDLGSILTVDDSAVDNTLTHNSTFDVIYSATDGNTLHDVTVTRTVTVKDTIPPELNLIGPNPYLIQPLIDFETIDPGYSNDASTNVIVDYQHVSMADNDIFNVTYTGDDGVHGPVVRTREVRVNDTIRPVITILGDNPYTHERFAAYNDLGATVDLGSTLIRTDNIVTANIGIVGSYYVEYEASDNVNENTIERRIVNVVDTTPPTVLLNGADPLTMERFDVFSDIDPGITYQAPHIGTLVSVDISQLDNTAIGSFTVTYNVVDDQNNSNTISRVVTVVDTIPPVATLNNPSTNYALERYGDWSAIDPGVTTDEGSFVKEINVDTTTFGVNRPVEYVISDGNTLQDNTLTRYITIVDTIAPYAELLGSLSIRVPLNSAWEDVDPGLTNFDAGSSLDYVSNFNNTISDAQLVHYNLTDGVNSNIVYRVVTCTLPEGEVNTAVSTTLERFSTYVEPDEAIINIEDGYLAGIDTSNVDSTVAHGTQQMIVYDLGDNINNTLVTRTITVQDTVPPYAELIGSNNIRVPLNSVWGDVDPGIQNFDSGSSLVSVTGFDNTITSVQTVSYNLTDGVNSNIVYRDVTCTLPSGTVNTAVSTTLERFETYVEPHEAIIVADGYVAGIDTNNVDSTVTHGDQQMIVYDLGDNVNNTLVTRTITIQDTTPPVITITNNTLTGNTLERFDEYVDEGATTDLGSQITNTDLSQVQNTAIGSFDVVYTANDGNTTVTATRTVTVSDTVPPVITITNDTPTGNTLELFDEYVDAGATVDLGSQITNIDISQVQNTAVGSFDVVYTANDGNTTVTATRTVTVEDTTPPVITLIGDNPYTVGTDTTYVDPQATADGGETVTPDTSQLNMSAEGTYTVTYSATDASNNTGTATRTVIVKDREFIQQAVFTSYTTSGYGGSGTAVSLSEDGNTAIVGREHASSVGNPAVSIYTRSGSTWSGSASGGAFNLSPPSGISVTSFGHAVDISGDGDYAIVSDVDSSNAYIYAWSGSTWSHQQIVSNVNVVTSDRFGDDVAIDYDGNTVVVGASRYDVSGGGDDGGAVFIFTRSGTTWSQQAKLTGPAMNAYNYFGESVDISNDGNTVIVGAWRQYYKNQYGTIYNSTTAAYIFTRSGTTWSQQQQITRPSNGLSGDMFASDVSISGDGNTALVSAYNQRFVWVYTRSGTTWSLQTTPYGLTSSWSLQTNNDWNGYDTSISTDGNTIIISAHLYTDNTTNLGYLNRPGAFFIFHRSGTTWTETQKIMNPQAGNLVNIYGGHDDEFGKSVAMSADSNVVIMSNVNNAVWMFNYELPP